MQSKVVMLIVGLVFGLAMGYLVATQQSKSINSSRSLTDKSVATSTRSVDILLDGYVLVAQVPTNWNVGQLSDTSNFLTQFHIDESKSPLFAIARENVSQQQENELRLYADSGDVANQKIDQLRKNNPQNDFIETSFTLDKLSVREVTISGGLTKGRSWYITVPTDRVKVDDPTEQKGLTTAPKTILMTQGVNYGDDKEFDQQIDKIIQSLSLSSVNGGQPLKFQ